MFDFLKSKPSRKTLVFKSKYFSFKKSCKNFTIRKGINDTFSKGDWIYINSDTSQLLENYDRLYGQGNLRFPSSRREAKIIYVEHIRFSDIDSFSHWHLSLEPGQNPIDIMKDIYGEFFSENEIVTVIWFQLVPS